MKAKTVLSVSCLVIIFSFIIVSQAKSADWILFELSESGVWYYDNSSIEKNKNITRVWTKYYYGKERKDALGFSHDMTMYEFDCKNENMRIITNTTYELSGSAISSYQATDWRHVVPESIIESLKVIVCTTGKTPNKK